MNSMLQQGWGCKIVQKKKKKEKEKKKCTGHDHPVHFQ